jgi:uncharacterized protein (TIGR03435 family)
MQPTDDSALLRQYAENNSDEAFAALVTRHINLVYSVALREASNPHHAEEITHAVFIILAKKAASLRHDKALASWLFQTTRLTANNFVRSETRRHRREEEAYMQSALDEAGTDVWPRIAPLLDTAVAGLREKDRQAIVLRFYEGRNLREVGLVLGASEDAAEKRVNRALEKLRKFFTKRGVSSTTAIIAGTISANSVQAAPVLLAKSVTAVAIAKGAAASGSTLTLIKGALKIMAWTKMKTTIVAGVVVLLATGITTITIEEIQEHRTYPWQVAAANSDEGVKALNTTPPQVTIVRSKFTTDGHGGLIDDIPPKDQWRYIGIHFTPSNIIERAYSEGFPLLPSQIVFPSSMPNGFYDYIANLPNGSQRALQELIKKKFGLVGKYEMRNMDVFLLTVDHPNALGLKPATPLIAGQKRLNGLVSEGLIHNKNVSMSRLAKDIGWNLQIPVIDQTGWDGSFDFDFPENLGVMPAEKLQNARQWLVDQLGLQLVPTNVPIEMLVVENTM